MAEKKDYFVLDKADMVYSLGLLMPYGTYLKPMLKSIPIEHLSKVYEAYLQQAKEYNHMEDRMREAINEATILRRRLASFERTHKRKSSTSRNKNSN